MATAMIFLLFIFPCIFANSDHNHDDHPNLEKSYSFKSVLNNDTNGIYTLHWRFDKATKTIFFAVNVSTNGWVGLGLSPNGGMKGSDIVTGWVNNGISYFQDRHATGETMPSIDDSQDWFLISGMEEEGWTILEFSRNWITCDIGNDRDIKAETARVIWAWHDNDPEDPISLQKHRIKNSISLNLLGGQVNPPRDPSNLTSFTIAADNVTIPNHHTTYWCVQHELPDNVQQQRSYITKYSPDIAKESLPYVHHILIYLCPPSENDLSQTAPAGDCEEKNTDINNATKKCRKGVLIAAWAIGGQEFIYPEDVAYPIGGPGNSKYLLMELHYNNPEGAKGVRDSSGIKFSYIAKKRKHNAGISSVGHLIKPYMIIPPNATSYTVLAECSSQCTEKFFPADGINIFANFLHTHLIGKSVELQHYRLNREKCNNGYEELKPVESNPTYDFDYQQTNFLPQEINVKPGDVLRLRCVYNSSKKRENITVGGLSTEEEMCLSFPVYYPEVDLGSCGSTLANVKDLFVEFANKITPRISQHQRNLITKLNANSKTSDFQNALDPISWEPTTVNGLQATLSEALMYKFCFNGTTGNQTAFSVTKPLSIGDNCHYKESNTCNSSGYIATAIIDSIIIVVLVTITLLLP